MTANDNLPQNAQEHRTILGGGSHMRPRVKSSTMIAVSEFSPVKRGVHIEPVGQGQMGMANTAQTLTPSQMRKTLKENGSLGHKTTGTKPVGLVITMLFWLLAMAATFYAYAQSQPMQQVASLGLASGLLSILLVVVAGKTNAKLAHSLGLAASCMFLGTLGWLGLTSAGIMPSLDMGLIGLGLMSLAFSWMLRAPYFLHLSLLASLAWTGLGVLDMQVSNLAWLFPALWAMQMFLALEFRFKRSIVLCISAGVAWMAANWYILS